MKPTTKFQKQVYDLSKSIPYINNKHIESAYSQCLTPIGRRTKNKTTCLECGYSWNNNDKFENQCPLCKTKLQIKNTLKRKFSEETYFLIIDTFKDFQVLRYLAVEAKYELGKAAQKKCDVVMEQWIAPDGRYEIVGFNHIVTWYVDKWEKKGEFDIKNKHNGNYYLTNCKTYPKKKYIKEIIRNGFKGRFFGLNPVVMFHAILSNDKAETLLKTKQYDMLKCANPDILDKYWAQIKLCIRNKYKLTKPLLWIDYIELLKYFNKDIHNAKYICPNSLFKEHDRLSKKKHFMMEKEIKEQEKRQAMLMDKLYKEKKKKFFDLIITDGVIRITPLKSIEEFIREGEILNHCIFSSGYYKKEDSLILSARINNEPIETIELSLKTMDVLQCYGFRNTCTEYHNQILTLMKENISKIKKIAKKNPT